MNVLIVEFNKLFGQEPLPINQYLDGISREKLLALGSHFLGFDAHNEKHLNFDEFLNEFFITNLVFKAELLARLNHMKAVHGKDILIVNTVSSLEFFEYVFMHGKDENTQSNNEIEKNIFLAYLAINQKSRIKEDLVFPSVAHLPQIEQIGAIFFTQSYAYSNLINYNQSELIVTQFIKAAFFLEFLQQNDKTKTLYQAFLAHYGFKEWKEYLKKLFPFVSNFLTNGKESYMDFTVRPGDNFQKDCDFIDKLLLSNDNPTQEDHDYLIIRESPFYKIKDGTYRVIFSLFVIEKIYKALYFKLAALNKDLEGGVPQLKGFIGDEFSEKVLGYEILNLQKELHNFFRRRLKTIGSKGRTRLLFKKRKANLPIRIKGFSHRREN